MTDESELVGPTILDRRKRLADKLREIKDGASITGRWIEKVNYEAVGHDPRAPDEGFYNRLKPPDG